jgi:hypothetical protein
VDAASCSLLVVFLTGSVPELKVDCLTFVHHVHRVVIEDRWYVFARESICSVGDEETSLSNCSIADSNDFEVLYENEVDD